MELVPSQADLLIENRELKKKIAKLEWIIEKLVKELPFLACQPRKP
ncbi:hypothetical protein LCGC14_1014170 [marine sediment metagenome]|uniref:Uncharacterized protein n=1 Tax=marine sediment metagenome TaxID=412755 RepID=A0A0F9NKV9_9ZZZZ